MSRNAVLSRLLCALVVGLFSLSFAPHVAAVTAATIAAPNVTVAPSQTVAVPLAYSHGTGNVISIQMRITWDPAVATLQTVSKGALVTANWDLLANLTTPGLAHIALISGGDGLTTSGELVILNFKAAAQAGTTPITLVSVSLNEGQVASTKTDGNLRVNTPPVAGDDAYSTNEDVQLVVGAPGVKAGDSDADGDAITVALDAQATHGTVALAADGSFTYSPQSNYFGPDTFTYKISDPWGGIDTGSVAITVNSVNDIPIADAHGPYTVPEGGSVTLSGTADDVDHTSGFIFEWDFDSSGNYSTIGATPSFSAAGLDGPSSKSVMLRVRDPANGLSTPKSAQINITNVAPTAVAGGPYQVAAGGTVLLDGSGSSDPAGADVLTYAWDLNGDDVFETNGMQPTFNAAGMADTVVTIKLKVTDDDGGVSNIAQTTVTVGVLPRYGLSGSVLYWKAARPVVGATLNLQGLASGSATSATGGAWSFANLLGGNYTVTPNYAADSEAITAYDAALVLQHAALNIELTGSAAVAANVNQAGGISALDASLILQHTVGLIPVPFVPNGPVWTFDPASHSYTQLGATQTGQNFTAILLGDPSGNWDGVTIAAASQARVSVIHFVPGQPESDGTRTIDVLLDASKAQPVASVDLDLVYDGAIFAALEPQAASGWLVAANGGAGGHLRIALANALPITQAEKVLTLRFRTNARDLEPAMTLLSASVNEVRQPVGMDFQKTLLPLIQTAR